MSNILLKAIFDNVLIIDPIVVSNSIQQHPSTGNTSVHTIKYGPPTSSMAQTTAILTSLSSIFSSSIEPNLVSQITEYKMSDSRDIQDSRYFPETFCTIQNLYPVDEKSSLANMKYGGDRATNIANRELKMQLLFLGSYATHFSYQVTGHNQAYYQTLRDLNCFLQILLRYSPTAKRFSQSLYLNTLVNVSLLNEIKNANHQRTPIRHEYQFDPATNTCIANQVITQTFGRNLKSIYLSEIGDMELAKSLRGLFTQVGASHHPVPLLELFALSNAHERFLDALANCTLSSQRFDENNNSNDANFDPVTQKLKQFFPAPSLRKIHCTGTCKYTNDTSYYVAQVEDSLANVIETYSQHPVTKNNIEEVFFSFVGVNDPYDIQAIIDVDVVILKCAECLPHCVKSLSLGYDTRNGYERKTEVIECFEKFEKLEKLEIFTDHDVCEDDDDQNLWSDDDEGAQLLLPRTLTELNIHQPVLDAKCLAQLFQSCDFPRLTSLRYRPMLMNDADDVLSKIFTPSITHTLRTLDLNFCFHEHCKILGAQAATVPDNEKRLSFYTFNHLCCDPKKEDTFLRNLENLRIECCMCCRMNGAKIETVEDIFDQQSEDFKKSGGGVLFPLPKSIKRLRFEGSTHFSLIRRMLVGDDVNISANIDDGENAEEASTSSNSTNIQEIFVSGLFNKSILQKFTIELIETVTSHPNLLKDLRRLSIFAARINAWAKEGEPVTSQDMVDLLDATSVLPSIEALELTGAGVPCLYWETDKDDDSNKIRCRHDLDEYLKEKGMEHKFKYLDLGTEVLQF